MRVAWHLVFCSLVLTACNEGPRCVPRGAGRDDCTADTECAAGYACSDGQCRPIVIECNAGKVPVCGMDAVRNYQGPDDVSPGALRPVPPRAVANGSCDGLGDNCRTRPICGAAGTSPTCADGMSPVCVLGVVEELEPETPLPDAGRPVDAGMDDAGMPDAGSDAGPFDAGPFDAGP